METVESWFDRRVAQVVEAGEVLAARETPQDEGHAAAIRQIADLAGVDPEKAAEVLATMEAQSTVTRVLLRRRIAEAWLAGQPRAHDGKGM